MSRDILLSLIDPDPGQPRKHFDEASLKELADSIEANGLAQPILLRPNGERFIIIHGERRYRAHKLLGRDTITAEVRDIAPGEAVWLSLVENIQRSDLSPIEEAQAYQARLNEGITQVELGKRIGKTQSYIAQKLRLLTLPAPIALYLNRGGISEGHARQLLKLRAVYPADYTMSFKQWADLRLSEKIPELDAWRLLSFPLLRDIRPEDNPICWFPELSGGSTQWDGELKSLIEKTYHVKAIDDQDFRTTVYLIAEGCRAFYQYVCDTEGNVPQWAVTAFWWATLAVFINLNVADLSEGLSGWIARFYTAIIWVQAIKKPDNTQRAAGKLQDLEYWGYRSDLKHAGIDPDNIAPELQGKAYSNLDGYSKLAPSSCQPWGSRSKEYKELVQKVDGA